MRDNSRSRSKSPTRSNDFKGDTRTSDPPCNKVYVTFLPEDVDALLLRFNNPNLKRYLKNVGL